MDLGIALGPQSAQRRRQPSLLSGRFGDTKVPGSYTLQVKAVGFSPVCNSRFVRHDLLSVVTADKRSPRV